MAISFYASVECAIHYCKMCLMTVADGQIIELMAAGQTCNSNITHTIARCTAEGPANQSTHTKPFHNSFLTCSKPLCMQQRACLTSNLNTLFPVLSEFHLQTLPAGPH